MIDIKDRRAQAILILLAILLGGALFFLLRPAPATLPPAAAKDLTTAEKASDLQAQLNDVAAKMASSTSPKEIEGYGREFVQIQNESESINSSTPSAPTSPSRDDVKAALRNISLAARKLQEASVALRDGTLEINSAAKLASDSDKADAASDLDKQSQISAQGQEAVRLANRYLRNSQAALLRAKTAIQKLVNLKGIDDEVINKKLQELGLVQVPNASDVKKLQIRLKIQEKRLASLSEEFTPAPAVAEPTISCSQQEFIMLNAFEVQITENINCNNAYNIIEAMINQCRAEFMKGFSDCQVYAFTCNAYSEPDGARYECRSSEAAIRFYRGG